MIVRVPPSPQNPVAQRNEHRPWNVARRRRRRVPDLEMAVVQQIMTVKRQGQPVTDAPAETGVGFAVGRHGGVIHLGHRPQRQIEFEPVVDRPLRAQLSLGMRILTLNGQHRQIIRARDQIKAFVQDVEAGAEPPRRRHVVLAPGFHAPGPGPRAVFQHDRHDGHRVVAVRAQVIIAVAEQRHRQRQAAGSAGRASRFRKPPPFPR